MRRKRRTAESRSPSGRSLKLPDHLSFRRFWGGEDYRPGAFIRNHHSDHASRWFNLHHDRPRTISTVHRYRAIGGDRNLHCRRINAGVRQALEQTDCASLRNFEGKVVVPRLRTLDSKSERIFKLRHGSAHCCDRSFCHRAIVHQRHEPNANHAPTYFAYFTITRQLFWPPKPKLFLSATRTSARRATFGT